MKHCYTLKLSHNKFYVGISDNVDRRIQQHFNGDGSEATKMYPPVEVFEIIEIPEGVDPEKFEDNVTRKMFRKHGSGNVRGGQWCNTFKGGFNNEYLIGNPPAAPTKRKGDLLNDYWWVGVIAWFIFLYLTDS